MQIQLKRMKKWEYYLDYLKKYPNSIQIVEFPQPFVFSKLHLPELDTIPFLCSSFNLDCQTPAFNSYGYCIDEVA